MVKGSEFSFMVQFRVYGVGFEGLGLGVSRAGIRKKSCKGEKGTFVKCILSRLAWSRCSRYH